MRADLFDLMPRVGRVRWWNLPVVWLRERGDPKLAIDFGRFLLSAVPVFVALCGAIWAVFAFLTLENINSFYSDHPLIFYFIVVSAAFFIVFHIVIFYQKYRFDKKLISYDIHSDFEILQHVTMCEVKSKYEITYVYRFLVRSKNNNIRYFKNTYSWSGHGEFEIFLRSQTHSTHKIYSTAGHYKVIEIDIGRNMNKNDEELIEFIFVTKTTESNEALPYLAIGVPCRKFPYFNTHLIVKFLDSHKPVALYREYFYSVFLTRAFRTEVWPLDEHCIHRWPVRTNVDWRYCVRWVFGA